MNSIPDGNGIVKIQMDRILESAVVLNWEDLRHVSQRGLIHIEYAPGKSLQYLKVWQLTGKGEWSLVCEYWMSRGPIATPATPPGGMTFSNGYHSEGLAQMLEVIMEHQGEFVPSEGPSAGLVQVTRPSEEEKQAANTCMNQTYNRLKLAFGHITDAAAA
jgi:hypothetical protein